MSTSRYLQFAYTAWGFVPGLRELLASRRRPLVLLSMPRSGSSWIGSVLGASGSALYLREPLTYWRRRAGERGAMCNADIDGVPASYEEAAQYAFRGIPRFPFSVIQYPHQWHPLHLAGKRAVIKEVNPLAIRWMRDAYRPDIMFILRHPMAIALSFMRLGWWRTGDWEAAATRISEVLQHAHGALVGTDALFVTYESVCFNPDAEFKRLATWAGLSYDDAAAKRLAESQKRGDRTNTYSTTRDSQRMADAWRRDASADDVMRMRNAYLARSPAWYADPADWSVD